jgi:CBS domain-containing protein
MLQGRPPLLAVGAHEVTLLAFARMTEAGVSGAPVTTDAGELIANLSVSDLRLFTLEHVGMLALPVAEFLALAHRTSYVGYTADASSFAAAPFFASRRPGADDVRLHAIRRGATLREVLAKLVGAHVHRLYVVDTDAPPMRAEHVVTLTDVLRAVAGVF